MEENHNEGNHNLNLGPKSASINLKLGFPDWLQGFFKPPRVHTTAIDDDLMAGYPKDDDV